jgi:SAM-dependent methyltransferase
MTTPALDPAAVVQTAANNLLARLQALAPSLSSDQAEQELTSALKACLDELSPLNLWGEQNRLWSSILWNAAASLLTRGWLQTRARTKPRGYAGDYELLAWIYEQRTTDDPLGRLFDRYFQAQAAPQAVRNRMAMMADWIVELVCSSARANAGRVKVALVGSALGLEIRDACLKLTETQRKRLEVVLIDMDPEAIEFASAKLNGVLPLDNVYALAANFFRLPQRPASLPELNACDLILCPGLFDYLNDEGARNMLRALYSRLAPTGRLIVFQFAPHNPTRAYMEWFGNWYLTYRDERQFRLLVEGGELPGASFRFGAEPLSIDLFAAISRPFGSG